ncbi:MAG: hypothetical protein ABUL42_01055, partial [Terricaulis silvestris]
EGAAPAQAQGREEIGPLSPQLARALFAMVLMPLLRSSGESQDETQDPLRAIAAYTRQSQL